jgi:ADP-heptose:LPS heptosyltransferase
LTNKPLDIKFALHLIDKLLQLNYKIILFGTQAELAQLAYKPHHHVFLACDKDIIKNLSLVRFCDLLIGGESVFKTMSSMSNITTLVLHEDNNNRFRDRTFINPYVNKGVMYVYKYKNLSKEILPAIQFIEETIKFRLPLVAK